MEKYYQEYEDALEHLWMVNPEICEEKYDWHIYAWETTGENITIARSLQSVIDSMPIFLRHTLNKWEYIISWDTLIPAKLWPWKCLYTVREFWFSIADGNSLWFQKYSLYLFL